MGSVDFGIELAAVRKQRRWDQTKLGEELAKLSGRKGQSRARIPKQTISMWETGNRWPEPWLAWLLCVLLDMLPDQLHLEAVVTPEVAARYERSTRNGSAPGDGSMLFDMADTEPARDLERLARAIYGVHPVDAIAADDMQTMMDALIAQRGRVSSRLLLVKLHHHIDHLVGMMARAVSHRVRRELACTAATTAVVAANAWQWSNDFGAARQMVVYARQLAAEAGAGLVGAMADFADTSLRINRLCQEDELSASCRDAVELLRRAERALAGGVDLRFSSILYATRAWVYAALRCELEADRDFDAAARELSRWTRQPDGLFTGIDATYLDVCQGKAALLLHRADEAVDHYEAALTACQQSWMRPTYQTLLAAAYGQAGEADQAVALLMATADYARSTGTTLLLSRIDAIVERDLAPFADTAAVRQLREALVIR